jgi:uncharacterized protein (TIGR03546 family)
LFFEVRLDSETRFVKRKLREFYIRFISLKGDPRKIAMGMAIGVFIGVTPTIPFHTILILFLTLFFRQNLTAAMLGAWIMNPVTIPVFYFAEYELGKLVLGLQHLDIALHAYSVDELLEAGWHIFYPLQIGGVILAPVFALPAYFITHKYVLAVRKRNERDGDTERPPQEVWRTPS